MNMLPDRLRPRVVSARKLLRVTFPETLSPANTEPVLAELTTEPRLATTKGFRVSTVKSVCAAAGVVPGFAGGVGGSTGTLAGKTQVVGFWKISPAPFEAKTGVPL